jgi:hypothetical protein
MAVSNNSPRVVYTGDGSNKKFAVTFELPANLVAGNTITDSTADMTVSSNLLQITTEKFSSNLVGKAISVTGANTSGTVLSGIVNTFVNSNAVTLNVDAVTGVTDTAITITTGTTGQTLRAQTDLIVFVDGVQQANDNSVYTVELDVGDSTSKKGNVNFLTAPADTKSVTLRRDVDVERTTDFQTGGALTAKSLNKEFDQMLMAVQDNELDTDLSLKFANADTISTADTFIPLSRANKILSFDASGVPVATDDVTISNINITGGNISGVTVPNVARVTGNVDGNVGNVTGNVGNVTGSVATVTTATTVGTITGTIENVGNVTNNVDNVLGTVNNVNNATNVTNILGSIASVGEITGDVGGNVAGNITGNVAGNVEGDVTGNVDGNITGSVNGMRLHNLLDVDTASGVAPNTTTTRLSADSEFSHITVGNAIGSILQFDPSSGKYKEGYPRLRFAQDVDDSSMQVGRVLTVTNIAQGNGFRFDFQEPTTTLVNLTDTNIPTTDSTLNLRPVVYHHGNAKFELSDSITLTNNVSASNIQATNVNAGGPYNYTLGNVSSGGPFTAKFHLKDVLQIDSTTQYFSSGASAGQVSSQTATANFKANTTTTFEGPVVFDGTTAFNQDVNLLGATSIVQNYSHNGHHANGDVNTTDIQSGDINILTKDTADAGINIKTIGQTGSLGSGQHININANAGSVTISSTNTNVQATTLRLTSAFDTFIGSGGTANIDVRSANVYIDGTVGTRGPGFATSNVFINNLKYPTADGSSGQVISTDGAGNLAFSTVSGSGITDIVSDTTPQLGGDLDVNGQSIVSASDGDISITPNGTGDIILDGQKWPQADGSANQYLKTDGAGQLSYDTLTTDDVGEGTNLYYTDARFDTRLGTKDTGDLSEGSNLYYTDARADARVNLQTGANLDLSSKSTTNLSEGTNLYYTDARADARVTAGFSSKSTSDLSEGTNLYFTDARAQAVSINNLVEDTTPQLGGNLDAQGKEITDIGAFELQGTDTEMRATLAGTTSVVAGETVTQATSGATGVVRHTTSSSTALYLDNVTGTFDTTNNLTGSTSGDLTTHPLSIDFQRANFGTTVRATSDTPQFISETDLSSGNHNSGSVRRNRSGFGFMHKFADQTDSLGDFSFQQRENGSHRFDIRLHSYSAGPRDDALSYDFKSIFHAREGDRVNIDPSDSNPGSGNPAISVRTSDIRIDHDLVPTGDNSIALGSGSKRFSTLHSQTLDTGDINMNNMDHETGNEVDGTRGSWTLQEGADDLFLINRSNGKKYKFKLEEIDN